MRIRGQKNGEESEERKTMNVERNAMTLRPDRDIANEARDSNETGESGTPLEIVDGCRPNRKEIIIAIVLPSLVHSTPVCN